MAKNTNKLKSLFSGINRTGEQLINSVLNNTNSSINSSESDLINPSLDEKERSLSIASSINGNEMLSTSSSSLATEAEGFLCPQCFAAFPNAEILTEHFSSEHSTFGDQNLSFVNCNHCRMRFTNEYELNQHVDKYHKEKSQKSDEPLIAQLDQSTTKQLTDSFSQVLKSAFNSTNNRQQDMEKMFTMEEFDLLQRQQKALEETKDLLLNELSLLRDSLAKKDEQINRLDRDFQQEKQLLVTQLNEAFQREKTVLENLNTYKDRTANKDDEMNRLRNENENLRTEQQRYKDQLKKITDEKMQQEKLCQKLQNECDSNRKILLDMTSKTSDSLSVMTNEKTELMNKLQQLQLEMDSIKKQNEDSERHIKCLQIKNSDSSEYGKQLEKIEQLRKEELNDHRNTIKQLKSDKLKYQNICRTRIETVRSLLRAEQNTTKQMRTILEQTHKYIDNANQQINQFVHDESKRNNELMEWKNQQIHLLIKEKDEISLKIQHLEGKNCQLNEKNYQLESQINHNEQEQLKLNEKYQKVLEKLKKSQQQTNEHEQMIHTLMDTKSTLEMNVEELKSMMNKQRDEYQQKSDNQIQSLKKISSDMQKIRYAVQDKCLTIKSSLNWLQNSCKDLSENLKDITIPEMKTSVELLENDFTILFVTIKNHYSDKIDALTKQLESLKSENHEITKIILPNKQNELEKMIKSQSSLKSLVESTKNDLFALRTKEQENQKLIERLQQTKQSLLAEIEKECARFDNVQKYHDQVLGEKLKLEIELSTFMEEKRALLERCATAEEQLEATIVEMKQIVKKYEENSKAVQELGEQNQTLQIRLDEANNKLRRSWTDDRMVDKCQNDKCQKLFTTVIRKHHCRSCGNIFCNECSSKQAQMTGHPKPVRVCDHCYQELNQS